MSDTIPLELQHSVWLNVSGSTTTSFGPKELVIGSGIITFNNTDREFSFHAKRSADGSVTGKFEFRILATGLVSSGDVSCFTIVGSSVRMAGPITSGDRQGFYAIWTAVDNGRGNRAPPDQLSPRFLALDEFHCSTGFVLPTVPLNEGQIHIKL